MSQSPHQIAEILFRHQHGWTYGEFAERQGKRDEEGAPREIPVGEEPPDDADTPAPPACLFLTAAFVAARMFLLPTWFGYDEATVPAYPTDKLFFCFGLVSLVCNFFLFLSAFLIKHSRDRLLHMVIEYFKLDVKTATASVIAFCAYQAFIFFRKAFRIFGMENDAQRSIQILVLLFSGLVNVWVKLAIYHGRIAKAIMFVNSIIEIFIKIYTKVQDIAVSYNMMERQVDMDYVVAAFAVWQYSFALGQISLHFARTSRWYDDIFVFWIYLYCVSAIAILVYVVRHGVHRQEIDPVVREQA